MNVIWIINNKLKFQVILYYIKPNSYQLKDLKNKYLYCLNLLGNKAYYASLWLTRPLR